MEGAVARDVFTEVIVLTAYGNVANAVECMKRGAFDYVEKNMPGVDVYELLCLKVQQAVERRRSAVDTVRRLEAFTKAQRSSDVCLTGFRPTNDAMTQISAELLQNWDESSRREWLVTNGIGGYASAVPVRGQHPPLPRPARPRLLSRPLGRAVLLSKLEEEVRVEDELYLLSANKYPSVVQPQGFRHLTYFNAQPRPLLHLYLP